MKIKLGMLLLLVVLPLFCFAKVDFILGIKEMTLISPDIDGFKVESHDSGSYYYYEESAEIEGFSSVGAILNMGLGIETRYIAVHLTGGAGYVFNGAFGTGVFTGETDLLFKIAPHFMMGPRAGVAFYAPSWIATEGDVTLTSEEPGLIAGYSIQAAWDKIKAGVSVDYQSGVFEVETGSGWQASDDELDISGVAVRLGVTFTF